MKSFFRTKLILTAVCLAAIPLLLSGCDDGRPKLLPTSGVVLIDGEPLTQGFVRFHPHGGRPATGELDKEGRFTLTCIKKEDGVVPGTHPVSVIACETIDPCTMRWNAPKIYISPKTSGLAQTIDGPTDSVKIELTWAGGKPFTESVVE